MHIYNDDASLNEQAPRGAPKGAGALRHKDDLELKSVLLPREIGNLI